MARIRLTINGKNESVDVDPDMPLLWVLRDTLGMTGTKYGCGVGVCGACAILEGDQAVRACQVKAASAQGKRYTTIEGLSSDGSHPCQRAWLEEDVSQCGYCQAGMIMAVAALLQEKPRPTDADIDGTITNICRCGTFQQVREAIHAAARA